MPNQPACKIDMTLSDTTAMRLYRVVLGREADPRGLQAYASQLAAGKSICELATDMVRSAEFESKLGENTPADRLCRRAYGRDATPHERGQSVGGLVAAIVADASVFSEPVQAEPSSTTYPEPSAAAAAAVLLYKIVLGRNPDPSGLRAYAEQLAAGISAAELASDMLQSTEFEGQLTAGTAAEVLCRNGLGRLPTVEEQKLPPEELAVGLVADPAVRERFSMAESLFPDGASPHDGLAYRWWLADRRQRRAQGRGVDAASAQPLLSVIVALRAVLTVDIESLVASLLTQSDGRIEAVIGCGAAIEAEVRAAVQNRPGWPAIHVVPWPDWLSAAALRDMALQRCRGVFVAFLDPHDRIEHDAVAELARFPDADILLSDEDTLSVGGIVSDPIFSGAWDPESVLAQPPQGLVAVRTALARTLGAGREQVEAEWDLLLRASLLARAGRIQRVPVVLLHRRRREQDNATIRAAGLSVLNAHLQRTGQKGCTVEAATAPSLVRVIYPLPADPPLVSIIIPTRDRADLLRTCLDDVLNRTAYDTLEVLVVDNDSVEAATAALLTEAQADRRVRVLRREGAFNWSALNNFAVAQMRGTVAVLLNNDIAVIEPGWLAELVSQALRPDVGLVGAKLLYPDGTVQHAGIVLGPDGRGTHVWRHAPGDAAGFSNELLVRRTVSAVTGACMAFRRGVFDQVGGFEERALKVTWSDTDLCLRIRAAGYRVVWTPHALLYHKELATRGSDETPEAAARYAREKRYIGDTWGAWVDSDPYFSPNLVPREGVPELALRPRPWLGAGAATERPHDGVLAPRVGSVRLS